MENIEKIVENEFEEVVEVAESIVPKTGSGMKVVGGAAVVLAVGYGAYRGIKYIVDKRKAKKEKDEDNEKDSDDTENE